jgi:hypothetical protein
MPEQGKSNGDYEDQFEGIEDEMTKVTEIP